MKVKDIQKAFYQRSITTQRYEIVAPNIYLDWRFNEMDLLCLRKSGYIDEIEIKLSYSDYLADFKKTVTVGKEDTLSPNGYKYLKNKKILKHDALIKGLPNCNYFSFMMPEELAERCAIPGYAGLYVCKFINSRLVVSEIKKPRLLHKRKISERKKYEIGRKMGYRYWNVI